MPDECGACLAPEEPGRNRSVYIPAIDLPPRRKGLSETFGMPGGLTRGLGARRGGSPQMLPPPRRGVPFSPTTEGVRARGVPFAARSNAPTEGLRWFHLATPEGGRSMPPAEGLRCIGEAAREGVRPTEGLRCSGPPKAWEDGRSGGPRLLRTFAICSSFDTHVFGFRLMMMRPASSTFVMLAGSQSLWVAE